MNTPTHFVYMVRCANGTIYTGQTHNLESRLQRHFIGTRARHTEQVKPIELIYTEGPLPFAYAVARERQLKKWSRAKKLALAGGNIELLKELSRCQSAE